MSSRRPQSGERVFHTRPIMKDSHAAKHGIVGRDDAHIAELFADVNAGDGDEIFVHGIPSQDTGTGSQRRRDSMRVRYTGKRAEPYPTSRTKDTLRDERTDEKVSSSAQGNPASRFCTFSPDFVNRTTQGRSGTTHRVCPTKLRSLR